MANPLRATADAGGRRARGAGRSGASPAAAPRPLPVLAATLSALIAVAAAATSGPAAAQPAIPGLGPFLGAGTGATGVARAPLGLGLGGYPFGTAPVEATEGPGRSWTITPSLGLQLLATDNLFNTVDDRRGDLITTISPGLAAEAATARLTGRLSYLPQIRFYADTPDRDGVDHFFNAQGLATLVEDRLFLDLRGFGGLQALGGGFTPDGTAAVDRSNLVQNVTLSASPYLVQRFGDQATGQLGYSYTYTLQDGRAGFRPGVAQPFFTRQETSIHQGYAVLRSGEAFGRTQLELRSTGTVFEGTGVLAGGHSVLTVLQGLYSLTRQVALLADVGYETQEFGGTQPISIEGPVWSVGVRLTPDPDSILTLRYGRRDGFESFLLDAGLDLGVRTRLTATYAESLGTAGLAAGTALSGATLGAGGGFASPTTGAPVTTPFGGSLLAPQNTISRNRRATLGLTQVWTRDTFSLQFSYDERTPVSSAIGTTGFEQTGTFVSGSWGRALTPNLSGDLRAQYGVTDTGGGATATVVGVDAFGNPIFGSTAPGRGDVLTLGLSLAQELSPGLFAALQYSFTSRGSDATSGRADTNLVILSLRQLF